MNKKKNLKIAIIGELVDADLVLAELLLRQGESVSVLRSVKSFPAPIDLSFYSILKMENICFFNSSKQLFIMLKQFQFVYSITSALFFNLRFYAILYPILKKCGWPPYIVICSGSNITERAIERSIEGIIERMSLRNSCCNILNNYPHAIRNAAKLRLGNFTFLPFPYAVDPKLIKLKISSEGKRKTMHIFHPSHLDWGQANNGKGRNSTKGTDRFLRAFIKACKKGLDAHCVILDRGADRENARKVIAEWKGEKFFTWKSNLTRSKFFAELVHCDLVIDQFDIQYFGGICIEAMAHGKPVIGFVDEYCHSLLFDEQIPIIQARTEEEIEIVLWKCRNLKFLQEKAIEGLAWVQRYQNPEVLGRRYLVYAKIAAGDTNILGHSPLQDNKQP